MTLIRLILVTVFVISNTLWAMPHKTPMSADVCSPRLSHTHSLSPLDTILLGQYCAYFQHGKVSDRGTRAIKNSFSLSLFYTQYSEALDQEFLNHSGLIASLKQHHMTLPEFKAYSIWFMYQQQRSEANLEKAPLARRHSQQLTKIDMLSLGGSRTWGQVLRALNQQKLSLTSPFLADVRTLSLFNRYLTFRQVYPSFKLPETSELSQLLSRYSPNYANKEQLAFNRVLQSASAEKTYDFIKTELLRYVFIHAVQILESSEAQSTNPPPFLSTIQLAYQQLLSQKTKAANLTVKNWAMNLKPHPSSLPWIDYHWGASLSYVPSLSLADLSPVDYFSIGVPNSKVYGFVGGFVQPVLDKLARKPTIYWPIGIGFRTHHLFLHYAYLIPLNPVTRPVDSVISVGWSIPFGKKQRSIGHSH